MSSDIRNFFSKSASSKNAPSKPITPTQKKISPKKNIVKIETDATNRKRKLETAKPISNNDDDDFELMTKAKPSSLNKEPKTPEVVKKVSPVHKRLKRASEVSPKAETKEDAINDDDFEEPISKPSPKKAPKTSPKKTSPIKEVEEKSKESKSETPKKSSSNYNYFNYQNRPPPPLRGKKEVPEGKPNCLAGKDFLITGVLDSLEREEAIDLIKKYGGTISKSITKKLTHVVSGIDAGEKKMDQARQLKKTIIDEDGLFDLISNLPSQPDRAVKSTKKSPAKSPPKPKEVPKSIKNEDVEMISDSEPDSTSHKIKDMLWQDLYRPKSVRDLIGNPGPIKQLADWLRAYHSPSNKVKAALLSGPPGIGKTSAALLVTRELGYEPLEFNASDTRSKKSLAEHVAQLTENRSLTEFYGAAGTKSTPKKVCLIMDEVDGMSSGDRGGMAELILIIKKSKVPIICICNDRSSPKVRSLANYCLDLRFRRPTAQQALGRLNQIVHNEKISIDPQFIEKAYESVHGDIRQVLNVLHMLSLGKHPIKYTSAADAKEKLALTSKNIQQGAFDVVPQLFSSHEPLIERIGLYFVDYSLIPLFIQENYLNASPFSVNKARQTLGPEKATLKHLEALSAAADSISDGDLIDRVIYSSQFWELQNIHAVLSTVRPTTILSGSLSARLNFPSWLGKNSSGNKKTRLLTEIATHMSPNITGDKNEVRLQYLPLLKHMLASPLITHGTNGIDQVIKIMDAYDITREDWDSIMEITELTQNDLLKTIPTNVKSTFTRTYNQHHHTFKVAPHSKKFLQNKAADDFEDEELSIGYGLDEETPAEVDEDTNKPSDDDLTGDSMIKVGKSKAKSKKAATTKSRSKKSKPSKGEIEDISDDENDNSKTTSKATKKKAPRKLKL